MKQVVMAVLLLCALVAVVSAQEQNATATNGSAKLEQKAPDQGPDALVVFYRPKRFMGSGLTPSVYMDGNELARLDNGRFFSIRLTPGKHQVSSSMKHPPLDVEVKSGETVYLEMVILSGNWRGGGRFVPAPTDDALAAIGKLKSLDQNWVKDPKVGFAVKMPATADQSAAPAKGAAQ